MKKSALLAFSLSLLTLRAAETTVKMKQTVNLVKGWNAVYLRVGPEEPTDVLFREWPVKWVALYDPSQYGDTRQFDQKRETEGATGSGYLIWRRGDKGASTLFSVPANSVLVAFATNACTSTLYGTPQAPRLAWHDSLARGMMNIVGFSTYSDTLTDTYFSGLDVGDAPFYVFGGGANANYPTVLPVTMVGTRHFKDGEVLLLESKRTSDWSGVLNVSPADGLDFGTELNKSCLEVRNDGAEPREVEMIVRRGELPSAGAAPAVPAFHWRDSVYAVTNGPWTALAEGVGVRRELSTGETWKVELAVDRTKLTAASGTVYGAIFEFRDVSEASVNEKNVIVGGSHMNAFVPVTVTGNGKDQALNWQRGLWLAHADLDTVTYLRKADTYQGKKTFDLPSGGKMTVRLPVYIESKKSGDGINMFLLQRFWYGRDTNGVLKVFSGSVKTAGEPLTDLKRLSTPFVPTDTPVTSFSAASLTDPAVVKFTVGEASRVNPMYHANHPQHDGLKADYGDRTPSGDNLKNYVATVKPETFSVTNSIEFAWARSNPAWEPEETMTGMLTWEFEGLRHQEGESPDGKLRARGRFTMKKLTSAAVKLK